jgi:hypothetical protein
MTEETIKTLEAIPDIDALVVEAKRQQVEYVERSKTTMGNCEPNAEWQSYVASQKYFLKCLAANRINRATDRMLPKFGSSDK